MKNTNKVTNNVPLRFYFTTHNPIYANLYEMDEGRVYESLPLAVWFDENRIDFEMNVDWHRSTMDCFLYYFQFYSEEHAMLFKLTWYNA